jgi:hypothetical protein
MSSRRLRHLKPLPRQLSRRMLALCLHYLPGEGPLQAKCASRAVCWDVLGAPFEQEQLCHDRYSYRAFDAANLCDDLMLAHAHDPLLAPSRRRELLEHLAKQRIFGLVAGVVLAPEQRAVHRNAIDAPLGHEEHDPEAEHIRMMLTEVCFLGDRMLGTPLGLQRAIANQIQDAILRRGKAYKAWSTNHHSRAFVHQ